MVQICKLYLAILLLLKSGTSSSFEFCKKITDYQPDGNIASCSVPGEDFPQGRWENGTITREENLLPKWINVPLAKQGQVWAMKNYPTVSFSHLAGLVGVLAFPDAYKVLHYTNRTTTPKGSSERYGSTIKEVSSWYYQEIKEDPSQNKWLSSLKRVRGFHSAAMTSGNKRILSEKRDLINPDLFKNHTIDEKMWTAVEKDLNDSNIPKKFRVMDNSFGSSSDSFYAVSQFQLAMTQFAFVAYPVYCPDRLKIYDASDKDLIAFNHLWAVLGYALGIEDKYNIALQPDLRSAKEMYRFIWDHYYYPVLFNCNFYCKLLIESMLKGFEIISGLLTPKIILLRLLQDILMIPTPNLSKTFTPKDIFDMAKFYTIGIPVYLETINDPLVLDKHFIGLSKDFFKKLRLYAKSVAKNNTENNTKNNTENNTKNNTENNIKNNTAFLDS